MNTRYRILAAQGVLSLVAFSFVPSMAADAPSALVPAGVPVAQTPQQPRPNPNPQPPVPTPTVPDQQAPQSATFTGTIMKDGSSFVLKDSAGTVYQLDAQDKAQPFEGKPVKVTGMLEETAKLIHVDTIEAISA